MTLEYAQEKMHTAVEGMATSTRSLQDRIHSAYKSFHTIDDDDLPTKELKELYAEIMERLTADRSDSGLGYVPKTLQNMADDAAYDLANLIVSFARAIDRAIAKGTQTGTRA